MNAPPWDNSEAGPCARETVEHSELSCRGLEVLAQPWYGVGGSVPPFSLENVKALGGRVGLAIVA